MDIMLQHPGAELQVLIKEKGLTQKAFASILGKKISEVNELLKGKRNITIQRDYLLHQSLGTPIKYRIMKQIDYEYSLLNIKESEHQKIILNDNEESTAHQTRHSEQSEESRINNLTSLDSSVASLPLNDNSDSILNNNEEFASDGDENNFKEEKNIEINNSTSDIENIQNDNKVDNENGQEIMDDDFRERAQIFKSF